MFDLNHYSSINLLYNFFEVRAKKILEIRQEIIFTFLTIFQCLAFFILFFSFFIFFYPFFLEAQKNRASYVNLERERERREKKRTLIKLKSRSRLFFWLQFELCGIDWFWRCSSHFIGRQETFTRKGKRQTGVSEWKFCQFSNPAQLDFRPVLCEWSSLNAPCDVFSLFLSFLPWLALSCFLSE